MEKDFGERITRAIDAGKKMEQVSRNPEVNPGVREPNTVPEDALSQAAIAEVHTVLTQSDVDIAQGITEGA